MKHRIGLGLLMLLAVATTGCDTAFTPQTPKGFVAFDTGYDDHWWQSRQSDSEYDYRATTADGVFLAVRRFKNDPKGDIGYWSEAIAQRLAAYGSYTVVASHDIRNHQGVAGRELTLKHSVPGSEHDYRLAVYDRNGWLYVIESGGDADKMAHWTVALDEAVKGISFN